MKELLTEWRKFVNEVEDPNLKEWMGKQEFADPDVTIDTLIQQMHNRIFVMAEFLYPDDPEEMEELGSGEGFVRDYMSDLNNYTSVWFENHEVKEKDEDKARALKTFIDWLNRNIDEMIKISDSGDYENAMNSKAHNILRRIAEDETGNMLVALGAQLDKF
tara:strand:+ start:94 stop:576 length:483 start_codon:yes stop_codon:yes gene_type:complete